MPATIDALYAIVFDILFKVPAGSARRSAMGPKARVKDRGVRFTRKS
jgi:hypothetical protein